ncbi:hypothetical protein ARMGADRAFT_445754 [Armillaria gallica]|uniref:Secreted protein n=1 Tax=Armillaria gallica TaxID=47427 RepID=A0A2H3CXT1_ARMGA|nr:hypothetical protein ARMGADRAFT_445754 [Armillaria gallica]
MRLDFIDALATARGFSMLLCLACCPSILAYCSSSPSSSRTAGLMRPWALHVDPSRHGCKCSRFRQLVVSILIPIFGDSSPNSM